MLLATLLLSPHIPLLFMGEEYGETHPFLFFTDFHGDLAKAVREGRAKEFQGHAGFEDEKVPDPNAKKTFEMSKLDWQKPDSSEGRQWLELTRELLALRQKYIVPLLATAEGNAGRVIDTAEGSVTVSWIFPLGTLSIALNIGEKTRPLAELPGETLFAWPKATQDLAPKSIVVRLASGTVK